MSNHQCSLKSPKGKIETVEIIVKGDIVEKNIILELANKLRNSKLCADFSSSICHYTTTQKRVEP